LTWLERLEAGIRAHTGWNTPAERDEALQSLVAARAKFVQCRG
jgi:hypothetical protein